MNLSLNQRLLLYVLSATLLAWLVAGVVSVAQTRNEVEELFDAKLAQSAWAILSLVSHELREEGALAPADPADDHARFTELESHLSSHKYESAVAFQIWVGGGVFRFHSASAPKKPFSADETGFSDAVLEGIDWRVFTRRDETGDIVIRVAERREVREGLVDQIAWQFIAPLIVGLPILGLVVWRSVRRATRPLSAVAAAVAMRAPANLTRIEGDDVPSEIVPLISAINHLFERLENMLDGQRRFTADAAHELRSPLAALKVQAQVAQRTPDHDQRQQALAHIVTGVDRASHLVQQMLTLSRIDPETAMAAFEDVALGPLVREVVADLGAEAIRKQIDISLDEPATPTIQGNAQALQILVRNIVDNAIRYTPSGGRVEVRTEGADGNAALVVTDSGPGIPEEEREAIFRRFHRRGGNQVSGSGLGLSIARRIADLHGAAIVLGTSPAGGLEASIRFRSTRG